MLSTSALQRNIFVALDHSACAVSALNWALDNLSLTEQDTVTVVIISKTTADREMLLERTKTLIRAIASPDHSHLQYCVRVLPANTDTIGSKICQLVDQLKPDLLVLGSTAKSNLEGILSGSVSNYCIANANCPVVVARVSPASEVRAKKEAERSSFIAHNHPMWV
ncbi:UNVERIFIED_CONTAM: hypothetical protein HDU68_004750 [Siphonaria sp. JEL0065]|nr:hypothetical protein HDU68_004750 [Siphonaria sp. JEL0065]